MAEPDHGGSKRVTLPRRMRLAHARQFDAVRRDGTRLNVGPLQIIASPNGLTHSRIGLSIARRVGTAVKRNRLKRLLREAFRLSHHDQPRGYDLIISARAHELLAQREYLDLLARAAQQIDQKWRTKQSTSTSTGN